MADKIVIDVGKAQGLSQEAIDKMYQEAIQFLESGDLPAAQAVMQEVQEARARILEDAVQVVPLTPEEEEQKLKDEQSAVESRREFTRMQRNSLLYASDWTQLGDAPLTPEQQTAWKTYRQALRDLDLSDPDSIVWPEPPSTPGPVVD